MHGLNARELAEAVEGQIDITRFALKTESAPTSALCCNQCGP